jgi:hypothetical protein
MRIVRRAIARELREVWRLGFSIATFHVIRTRRRAVAFLTVR